MTDESSQAPEDAARAHAQPEQQPEPDDELVDTLWKQVLDDWEDDRRHAALLEYALRGGKLPDVAGRYRALKDDPARGKRAQKQLDAIVLSATQMMLAMKSPGPTRPPASITLSAVGVCVALLGLLAYALLHR